MSQAATRTRAHDGIVRLARRGLDLTSFLERAEEQLRRAVAFEGAACFFTIDPTTLLLTGHVNRDLAQDDERRRAVNLGVANNEYREDDVNKFAQLASASSRAGILDDATGHEPERSARYRSLMQPFGLEGELRAAFVTDDACWGGMAVFRTPDQPRFTEPDRRFVASLSGVVAQGIRTATVLRALEDADGSTAPGLILLDQEGRVEAVNPMATHWLSELVDPGEPTLDALPQVIHAVAVQPASGIAPPTRARVPTRSGRWLVLHGTHLDGHRKGSAIIIEPARKPEIAPLLLDSYGLTEREQTVTLCVLQGLSTAQIATRLFISAYTVQDHLKSVFSKVGVKSRRELVGRVFFDHYFPRMQEENPLGSTEWLDATIS